MNMLTFIIAAGSNVAPPKGLVGHLSYWAGPLYTSTFLVAVSHAITDAVRGRRDEARAEWRALEEEHRMHLKRRKANVADKR